MTKKLREMGFTEEDLEITDWDPADDFSSVEEMRGFLELTFIDNNTMLTLEAIDAVARAKGNASAARRAISLMNKNPSREEINRILSEIGFSWIDETVFVL